MNRAELNAMKARAARNARLNAIADRRALLRYVAELLRVVEDYAGACARCQGRGEYPYDTVTGDRKGRPCADCADIREALPG